MVDDTVHMPVNLQVVLWGASDWFKGGLGAVRGFPGNLISVPPVGQHLPAGAKGLDVI